jgi:hypothetical protein
VVVVFGDVLGENDLEVFGGKGLYVLVVGDIVVIVPVGELIMEGVGKAEEGEQADGP